jgi:diacylglycerol kinase (ATP)
LPDDTTVHFSANAEDAEDRARIGANEGFDVVLAAGGDGTIHQVVNGLMSSNRHNVTLGVAAIGSANDFAVGVNLTGESGKASPPWKSAFTIDKVRGVQVARRFVGLA